MNKGKEWLKEATRGMCQSRVLQSITINVGVLDNLIDQLDEPELPVIPQFVADRIEEYKEIQFGISLIFMINRQIDEDVEFSKWISSEKDNCDKVVRAWLDGYAIEKEKLYFVRENNYLLCKYNDEVIDYVEAVEREITDLVNLKLTEKEIKDYDERYWAFAEPVE